MPFPSPWLQPTSIVLWSIIFWLSDVSYSVNRLLTPRRPLENKSNQTFSPHQSKAAPLVWMVEWASGPGSGKEFTNKTVTGIENQAIGCAVRQPQCALLGIHLSQATSRHPTFPWPKTDRRQRRIALRQLCSLHLDLLEQAIGTGLLAARLPIYYAPVRFIFGDGIGIASQR